MPSPSSGVTKRTRQRAALNCAECRRRKVRCDRKSPCSHCVSLGKPCTFVAFANAASQSTLSRQDPANSSASASTRRPQSQLDSIESDEFVPTSIESARDSTQHAQVQLNKTRLLRFSHMIGGHNEFRLLSETFCAACGFPTSLKAVPEDQALYSEMGSLLQKCKNLAKHVKADRAGRYEQGEGNTFSFPTRDLANRAVEKYFRSFESAFRILHYPSFQEEYDQFWASPLDAQEEVRWKVLLVVALGTVCLPTEDVDNIEQRRSTHEWLVNAQKWLAGPIKKDRLELPAVQIHCLLLLARQMFSIGADLVWISAGSLLNRAMQMGLHRDPKYLPNMSSLQAELRRRLWWTIVEMLVQSSLDTAMPPRLSFNDFDTELPANISDAEISNASDTVNAHPREEYTSTSIQLHLLDSLPLRLGVLNRLTSIRGNVTHEKAVELSAELNRRCRDCKDFFRRHKANIPGMDQHALLDMLIRRFIIPLNGTFASQAGDNPKYYYSRKLALDASLSIMAGYSDPLLSVLIARGGGMFREGFRYACSLVTMELIHETQTQLKDGTLGQTQLHRDAMKAKTQELLDLAAKRIQHGETNVKSHMFLSMALAQCEAMENEQVLPTEVAKRAVESLRYCVGLLQEQTHGGLDPASIAFDEVDFTMDFDRDLFVSWPAFPF